MMTPSWLVDTCDERAHFDPRSVEFARDPFPVFEALRRLDPVHWSDALSGWVLTRYHDVKAGMDMSADFVRPFAEEYGRRRGSGSDVADLGRIIGAWPSFFDVPAHTRLRTLLNRVVNRAAAEALRPQIAQIAETFAGRLVGRDTIDVMAEFAYPLPVTVIGEMLGITSEAECRLLMAWSDDLHLFVGQAMHAGGAKYQRAAEAARNFDAYFLDELAARRARPRNDGLTRLIEARDDDGGRLADEEIAASCTMLFYAGHETTAGLIGLAVLALGHHPAARRRLAADPSLLPAACEEFFRYDGPVAAMVRVAAADCELGGKRIRRGDRLYPFINAANRDPEIFADPNVLDIERTDNRHIVFGHGVHYCIGAWLARAEAPLGLGALLAAFPDFALATDAVDFRDSLAFRAPQALLVDVRGASR